MESQMEKLLDKLLNAFDAKIQEEQGFRADAEKDSNCFYYGDGRVDGVDASRALVEQVLMEYMQPKPVTKEESENAINCKGRVIPAWFMEGDTKMVFDRTAFADEDGCMPLNQLRKDECILAPGAIYRAATNGKNGGDK
ncbi:hypothetical protein MOVI109754_19425 [Moritella viscosa]